MMTIKFANEGSEVFFPDNTHFKSAMQKTTHLAVSAHQDDIEIMALDGILKCFGREDKWFCGVVTTNGAGSPRSGLYADYTDEQMCVARRKEQKKAAYVGEYCALVMLDYPSAEVKNSQNEDVVADLEKLILKTSPEIIYVHNPADKHDTHVAVAMRTIEALRNLPHEYRPERIYGCEVWRALDWVNDEQKIVFDVAEHPNLSASLLGVYDTQICGGARYDLATAGRRLANATFAESHSTDQTTAAIYAIDLTPLVNDPGREVGEFMRGYLRDFENDVISKIEKLK